MLLIDAVFINNSGGKVLLDLLIKSFEETDNRILYLLDDRVKNNIPAIKTSNNVVFIKGYINRHMYYKKVDINTISKVFCFGNLPPSMKLNCLVYTYLHQLQFVETQGVGFFSKIIFFFKKLVLRWSKDNTNFWMVQTNNMGSLFAKKYSVFPEKILLMPFYAKLPISNRGGIEKEANTFLYVSNGYPHKNHKRLINAFCKFYDSNNLGQLQLTVSYEYRDIHELITLKQNEGYPIINFENIPHNEIQNYYSKSEYVVYPSLSESFGLGIVEAIECNCKIIGANLPYMLDVCAPSIIFDPYNEDDIKNAFERALNNNDNSILKVNNKLKKLIDIISKNNENKR